MSLKNNAVCSICGSPYYMCNSCKEFVRLYPYKLHTDTAEHFKIYQIIHGYSTKVYTKDEAKAKLKNVNLSDIASYKENIRNVINDILSEELKTEESEKIKKVDSDKNNKKVTNKKKDIIISEKVD